MGGFGSLRLAGQFVALSAALHVVAFVLSGFDRFGWIMLAVGVVYLALSLGLTRGMRSLGYLVFVLLLAGSIAAFVQLGAMADWVIWAIIAANLLALLNLFVALWRPREIVN